MYLAEKQTKGNENDVKNGYHEHPGKENLEKWCENAFFSPGTAKKMKNGHFLCPFLQQQG